MFDDRIYEFEGFKDVIQKTCSQAGLLLVAISGAKLEPGCHRLASGLAGAERRADRRLAARSLLERADDSSGRNAVWWRCSVCAGSRSVFSLLA